MNRVGFARMVVLALWSAFFAWLLVSGEVYRYIGPRTRWVVVFGAVMLDCCNRSSTIAARRLGRYEALCNRDGGPGRIPCADGRHRPDP